MATSRIQAESLEASGRGTLPAILSTALSLALALGVAAGYLLAREAPRSSSLARVERFDAVTSSHTVLTPAPASGLTAYLTDGPDYAGQETAVFAKSTAGYGPVVGRRALSPAMLSALVADTQLVPGDGSAALVLIDLRAR
jgi:hypothetical protein